MTAKRDLKKRVRARQAQTGERYTTARSHVVREAEEESATAPDLESPEPADARRSYPPIQVEEMLDLAADAGRLGIKCVVRATTSLAARVDAVVALEKLRDALLATENDPATDLLRAVVLRGERPLVPKRTMAEWRNDIQRFLQRAQAGIGGTSDLGNMLALQVGSTVVIYYAWLQPMFGRLTPRVQQHSLSLTLLEELRSPMHPALFSR